MKASASASKPVSARPYLMHNQVQHYEWGTRDDEAYIPALLGLKPEPGVPYAELWMGAHPRAPSSLVVDGDEVPLDQWIAAYPRDLLGTVVMQRFDNRLPFLLKVLAAGEALSIQAHPNKDQARRLHARDPEHYPDDNHKPEIAIALDSLSALMGIRPFDELADTLRRYPEIASFVGAEVSTRLTSAHLAGAAPPSAEQEQALTRDLLTALFTRAVTYPRELGQAIEALAQRLGQPSSQVSETERLFLNLRRQYTGPDVGLVAVFLLNVVHLSEGDCLYTAAGVPHAYLRGNIIECMANSDNVVRVGLTGKFKDTTALLDILRYEPKPSDFIPASPASAETVYRTPASEFQVSRLHMEPGAERRISTGDQPEVLIVTSGEVTVSWPGGEDVYRRGQSLFIPAKLSAYTLRATQSAEVFRAAVPPEP